MTAAPSGNRRLYDVLSERERRSSHRINSYAPYAKQQEFHAAGATYSQRLLRAGNQQGKTYSGGVEMAYHLTGLYPSWWTGRRFDHPVMAWAASDTGETTRDNPQRALFGVVGEWGTGSVPDWLIGDNRPAMGIADLKDYVKVKHVSGGWSTLRFKYYGQGRQKWQGPPVDVIWCDEEPPDDIYDEGLARTIATRGMAYTTFTPLLGMSEVVRRFLVEKKPGLHDTNMTIHDALHIPEADRASIIAGFSEWEREARANGTPMLGSGRIFQVAESAITVEPFAIPRIWPQIGALDFGWDHPTAAISLAWDRDTDCVYVTRAYRASQEIPAIHAAAVRPWGAWLPWAWPMDGLQHSKGDGVQLAEQYRSEGLAMTIEHAQYPELADDTRISRVSVEAGLLDMLQRMQTGRFKVFSNLVDWFEEYRLYHREDGKVVKLYDDLLSATRYGIMMLRFAKSAAEVSGANYTELPSSDWRL
jgi:phage terminase large subunit-like protein